MRLTVPVLLVAVLAAAGCGGTAHGTATLWVTTDRGAHVVLTRTVPAGLTAMQALERVAHVQTSYAGRYVQGIDGVDGSVGRQEDWFYFVNGYEADRGAAEYRLHPGDVEWWDYRSWKHALRQPVVVGAFPEPFVHGYDGKVRPAVVVYDDPSLAGTAKRLARVIHAGRVQQGGPSMSDANVLEIRRGRARVWVGDDGGGNAGGAVRIVASGVAAKLAVDPRLLRFRYALP